MEFFIDKSNHLYVNEIAPRPHNSGHYTIEACDYSQFDTHILAVTGQKLPQQIDVLKPAVMMNLPATTCNKWCHVMRNLHSNAYAM